MSSRALLAVSLLALLGAPAEQDDLEGLLDQVLDEPHQFDPDVLDAIAAHGTPESLAALKRAGRSVTEWKRVHAVYSAALAYRGELEADAIAWVVDSCQKARDDTHMLGAARALAAFGDRASDEQERVFARHRDERVKDIVFQPLVPSRGREGTPKAVGAILDHGDLRQPEHRRAVLAALASCTDPKVDKLLVKRLGARDTRALQREALVTLLSSRPGSAVDNALLGALGDIDWAVQVRALEALASRGHPSAARKVEKLLASEDARVTRETVLTLDALIEDREGWRKTLLKLARSDERGQRMGAAVALAKMGGEEEIRALERLYDDPSWTVRAEAYEAARRRGAVASIPALEARLGEERGRLRGDLVRALAELRGVAAAARPLPTFFGVPIEGRHVAFLIDRSSTMGNALKSDPWTGQSRLQAAARELGDTLNALPLGTLVSAAFFDSELRGPDLTGTGNEVPKIVSYANGVRPGRGGTDLHGAILEVLLGGPETLLIVADGDPNLGQVIDSDLLVERIERRHRANKVRIHTVALGRERALLERLAAVTGGEHVHFP